MRLVKKLLARENRFSTLLKASAEEVQANVKALDQLLNSASPAVSLKAFLQSRAKEQEIKAEIDSLLCQGHRTPLEHADVEALARLLNRTVKGLRKFAERYLICGPHIRDVSFGKEIQLLVAASAVLHQMVASLGAGPRVATAKTHNDELQKIEADADSLIVEHVVAIYQGRYEPMKSIMVKDLYEQLDRVFARCRSAGDLVLQIVLKNS